MKTAKVIYDGPIHQRILNPTREQLRELVFETNERYWTAGSGDGTLRFESTDYVSELALTKVEPYGFRLLYKGPNDDHILVSLTDQSLDDVVPVFECGEYSDEPVACFIDLETAYEAVLEFCKAGLAPRSIHWERWDDLLP